MTAMDNELQAHFDEKKIRLRYRLDRYGISHVLASTLRYPVPPRFLDDGVDRWIWWRAETSVDFPFDAAIRHETYVGATPEQKQMLEAEGFQSGHVGLPSAYVGKSRLPRRTALLAMPAHSAEGSEGSNRGHRAHLDHLVAWTLRAAQQSGCCSGILVSTDDAQIAAIARHHGVSVPWLRPAELATRYGGHCRRGSARDGLVCAGTRGTASALPRRSHGLGITGEVDYGLKSSEQGNTKVRRSQYFVKAVRAGEIVTKDSVRSVPPGFGLPPRFLAEVIGRKTSRAICANTPVHREDLC